MPPKVRELISQLKEMDLKRDGKGSHRHFTHPYVLKAIIISVSYGDDKESVFHELCQIVEETICTGYHALTTSSWVQKRT